MKNSKRILCVIALLLISVATITNIFKFQNEYNNHNYNSGDKNDLSSINNNEAIEAVSLSVTCSDEENSIIPLQTTFDLNFESEVAEDYVKQAIKIEPAVDYKIEKINNKYYKLKTVTNLEEGKIYNVVQTTVEGTEKWAFQTEKSLEIKSYYPVETANQNSVISLTFNALPQSNIEDYISIEPQIAGSWVVNNYEVRFQKATPFEIGTEYTIKVKKGLESKEGIDALENDFEMSFYIEDSEAPNFGIQAANAFKTTEDVIFNLYFSGQELNYDDFKLKVLNLKNKQNYINALKNQEISKESQILWNSKDYEVVYSQDITAENARVEQYGTSYNLNKEISFDISAEGYFVILIKYEDYYFAKCIQINDYSVTCNTLKNNELLILTKGPDNKNNNVDVLINGKKIGTTDNDGLLFIEDYEKLGIELDSKFNYIEFGTNLPLILDTEDAIYEDDYDDDDRYLQFNNGYLYTDRETYDVGETIHFWGFAKNRVRDIDEVKLRIDDGYKEIEFPIELNEKDCFTFDYVLDTVNSGSYITCNLIIDGMGEAYKYIKVVDYTTNNYDIQINSDKNYYINGETAIINIDAATYDGMKLKELEFSYRTNSSNMATINGSVKTDDNGSAKIEIPLNITYTENYLQNVEVNILNSMIDGEQGQIYLQVYPYKNQVTSDGKYIINQNTYKIELKETHVLNRNKLGDLVAANDKVSITALAYKTEKYLSNTYYDEYRKEMVYVYSNRETRVPENDKTVEVEIVNGKGAAYVPNWGQDYQTNIYKFQVYLIKEDGEKILDENLYYIANYLNENDEQPYNDGYENGVANKGLALEFEKDIYEEPYKFGETIKTILKDENGNTISDYSNIEIYTYLLSGEGEKIIKTKTKALEFIYTEEMGNDLALYSVIYDGKYAYSAMNYFETKVISVDREQVELTLDVKFDKEVYAPGDNATITIKTTDHGNPISAGVNISAVDTAFIDANGESDSTIINSLENYYFFFGREIATRKFKVSFEGGGGGGDGEPRSNLLTTAIFENIITDSNGEAQITIKLPENITEWTITSQAISDNFKAASTKQVIKVSKDFYVDMTHVEKYLENEKFNINIKSFSDVAASTARVEYLFEIIDSNNQVVETANITGTINEITSYTIKNSLKTGTYKIKLSGTCEGKTDAILEEINVVDNLLTVKYRENLETIKGAKLIAGDAIEISGNQGALYISNKDVSKIIKDLIELSNLNEYRNDSRAIKKEARRILEKLYNNEIDISKTENFYINNSMKIMENSSEDASLALRILAIGSAKNGYTNEVLNRLEQIASREAVLWAYASAGKPVLKELREQKESIMREIENIQNNSLNADNSNDLENNIDNNIDNNAMKSITLSRKLEDVLYVALGLSEVGDFSNAKELFEVLKTQITTEDIKSYELLTILAIKLNLAEREELYAEYLKFEMPPENEDFIKLYYIQNEINKNFKSGKLTLTINDETKEIDLKNVGLTKFALSKTDDIVIKKISDNLAIIVEDNKAINFEKYPSSGYIISKEYNKSNSANNAENLYTVTIKLDIKKLYEDSKETFYRLEDVIPNNMTFVSFDSEKETYLEMKDGQKLIINCFNSYGLNNSNTKSPLEIKYTVRQTNEGEQLEAGTVLVNESGEIVDTVK